MKAIKKVKYKSGDLILRKNGGLILLVTGSSKKKRDKGKGNNDSPKKGPGRPKGSKNKKTLLMEARQAKREKRKRKDGT